MGIANALILFVFRKHENPWEVVDNKAVDPVPLWDDDDDLDILYVHEKEVVRTYVFDVRKQKDLRSSLAFAQQQFLQEVTSKGYNALWAEGWTVTLLRKAKKYRVEVRYVGRPACLSGKPIQPQPPPFMGVLDELQQYTGSAS
ncbi:hypothetical protein FA95DRAFT_1558094 [Auriscalpium vulgare]|uniref:Uncharacterized protein n=1 Tax=Auriscalpium vulgare TaxID=40419 RepID=A0ACB8RXU1_9AGAM|nr:hypothetical protein FA95DRAFT_1558094 [Auriscalpium vulgare]